MYDMILSETMDGLKQPITAFCVGGGGSHLERGSVAFNYINRTLSNYDITSHNVHGVTDDTTSSRVRSPSEQYEEIMDNVSDRGKEGPVLLIAQCMGTIAAHQALLSMTEENINTALVTFSPPLPNPSEVIKLPNSRKRRRHNDTEMQCPMFPDGKIGDFSVLRHEWLPIPRKYFHDIQETRDLEEKLRQSVEIGRAAVIAAERDWNTSTPLIVSSWRRSWQLRGLHEARQRAIIVPKAGHSLHPSGKNKHLAPLSQQQACQLVVDTGLRILSTSFPGRDSE
jgi:hypothetical protein cdiviTM7_00190